MNSKNRVNSEQVKLRVLLCNKRACCVCHAPDKSVQVHHIDGNPANTVEKNLAVLCLTHHDQATAGLRTGQIGFGVKLSQLEVRAHKSTWEAAVSAELETSKKPVSETKRKQIEFLFEIELMKERNHVLAARNIKASRTRLGYLTEYVIEEFVSGVQYRKMLLESFKHIALRGAGDKRIALPLVAALLDLHPHLIGPKYVALGARDRSALIGSLDVLDTVGIYGVEIHKDSRTLQSACSAIAQLVEIGSWYKFDALRRAAIKTLHHFQTALVGLSSEEKSGMQLASKERMIARTLLKLLPSKQAEMLGRTKGTNQGK